MNLRFLVCCLLLTTFSRVSRKNQANKKNEDYEDNEEEPDYEEKESEQTENDDEKIFDTSLVLPYYIGSFNKYNTVLILWCLFLGISFAIMVLPIPKSKPLQKRITIGLGMLLASNHLLGIFMIPVTVIWISSFITACISYALSYNPVTATFLLTFCGAYIAAYFCISLFSSDSSIIFLIYMVVAFGILTVVSYTAKATHYLIVKTLVCTLVACVMINVMTFINILSSLHASNWNVTAKFQAKVGKLNESNVEILYDDFNVKKIIGFSYITGYGLGTVLGFISISDSNRINNITRCNAFLANVLTTTGAALCITNLAYITVINKTKFINKT